MSWIILSAFSSAVITLVYKDDIDNEMLMNHVCMHSKHVGIFCNMSDVWFNWIMLISALCNWWSNGSNLYDGKAWPNNCASFEHLQTFLPCF